MADSLFYEYAITPDVFDANYISSNPRLEVILVQLLKGISENGMIADLNRGTWFKHVDLQKLPDIKPSGLKAKVSSLLKLLCDRHRIVRHPKAGSGDPTADRDWLSLAIESHRNIKLDGIIATREVLDNCNFRCDEFIDALNVLDSARWEGRRRTLTLPTSEPYYRPVLDPVLRHARSLTIVDPYFSPHKPRFVDFLKICIEQMGRRGGQPPLPGRIIIHAGDPDTGESVADRLNAWENIVKSNFCSSIPHKIKILLRHQKNSKGKRFHDRYILTDQCCIDIPLGMDTESNSTPDKTTWCLLDHADMLMKAEEIDPAMEVYGTWGERLLR